jgi:hypothetical protein
VAARTETSLAFADTPCRPLALHRVQLKPSSTPSNVRRVLHGNSGSVQHVCIDHGGGDVAPGAVRRDSVLLRASPIRFPESLLFHALLRFLCLVRVCLSFERVTVKSTPHARQKKNIAIVSFCLVPVRG